MSEVTRPSWMSFAIRIVLPATLAIGLFIFAVSRLIIPMFERKMMEDKREMIRELSQTAWSILAESAADETAGRLTREAAQQEAISRIRGLRYGDEGKDYFWVTDLSPRMIVHPYRPDLDGQDLADFTDPQGKRLFVELVKMARETDNGYVEYLWQWKDDPSRVVPKLSYVIKFEPWGWVIGTGIYLEDVEREMSAAIVQLIRISSLITAIVAVLLLGILYQSIGLENRRRAAETSLHQSREKYRALVRSSTDGLILVLNDHVVYANLVIQQLLGYGDHELLSAVLAGKESADVLQTDEPTTQFEARLQKKDGSALDTVVTVSRISISRRDGFSVTVKDVSEEKQMAQRKHARAREALLAELQAALHVQEGADPCAVLMDGINRAKSAEEIADHRNRIQQRIKALVDSGIYPAFATRTISAITAATSRRLVSLALAHLGPPPIAFTWLLLGSAGRQEQTLATDQDNALIYAETQDVSAREYFLELGRTVCVWLDQAGYSFCPGKVMAMNPKWCQPLSGWQKHFSKWICTAEPQSLRDINVFFDFQPVYGEAFLVDSLRDHINVMLTENPPFFLHMANNALLYRAPLGLFGKISVSTSGDHPLTFSVKEAMQPVVNFARLYALKHRIAETNTWSRLQQLHSRKLIQESTLLETVQVYDYLMNMRLRHQSEIFGHGELDNFVDPKTLTHLDNSVLATVLARITTLQTKLSYDFRGLA